MKVKERIRKVLEALNRNVFEKEEVIALALLSACAGESIFLLGPPGVAKSLIARRLKFAFKDGKSFEYLMNRFSTPDEIFGPVAISKLKNDLYERIVDNYLPDANVIFLDEIWKASPSIQNTLLTVLNEKKYRNGTKELSLDIRGLIAASNELPEMGQGLEALWDRFVIRLQIGGVEDRTSFNRMISENLKPYEDDVEENIKITASIYKSWSEEINKIQVPEEVFNVIHVIRALIQQRNEKIEKPEQHIYLSDRRWRKIIRILRTSAFLNERTSVDLMDCLLIVYCIWDEPQQLESVKEIVANSIKKYGYIMSVDMEPLKKAVIELEQEVTAETKVEKNKYKEEPKEEKKGYYKIEGLDLNYVFLKKTDFYEVEKKGERNKILYNSSLGDYIYVNIFNDENYKIRVLYRGRYRNCTIQTHKKKYTEIITNKPSKRLIEAWDEIVVELKEKIKKEIKAVEDYKTKNHKGLKTNLFVNANYSHLVEGNFHTIIRELQDLIVQVDKIKHNYDAAK